MSGSWTLLRIRGIEIQVHWSFALILIYGAFIYAAGPSGLLAGALYGILVILLLFLCVVLHELGHAVTAQAFGIRVPYITLLPIGGVAQLERMPRKPWQEFLIAIAGPLVNFALVALLLPISVLLVTLEVRSGMPLSFWRVMRMIQTPSLPGLILYLTFMNATLGLFNLLPAFPMDGGRILRALLAMTMPYLQATRLAVAVGRAMALLFAIWGLLGGGIFLLLIAFFIYVGGGGELENVESRFALRGLRARDALTRQAYHLYITDTLQKAVDYIMTTYQADFPVFDLAHNFVGVLTRARLVHGLREYGPEGRVVDVMIPAEQIPVVAPDTSLADVWDTMLEQHSRVVAVREGREFLGLITLDDISEVVQVMGATQERMATRTDAGDRPAAPPAAPTPQAEPDEPAV